MLRVSTLVDLFPMLLAVPALAAAAPSGAPASALPTQLFIAPSGEPFRAGLGEPYPVAAWFSAADRDRDGKLTEGEFVIDVSRYFGTLDSNHNEQLDRDEIKHYENDIAPEVRSGDFSAIDWNVGGAPGKVAQRRALGLLQVQTDDLQAHVPELWSRRKDALVGAGGSNYGIISIPEPVRAMDTDLNGIVSKREMLAAAQRRFRLLDTEERNYLVLAELPEP